MRYLILLWLSLAVAFGAAAQTSVLQGRVLSAADSTGMVGTTVVLSGNLQVNAMSGPEGRFELKGVPYGDHQIQFVFLGYNHKIIPVRVTGPVTRMGNIYLTEDAKAIDEVVVRAQAPMAVIKNDTVQYNAEAFKTNPDADVEELITKMPGVIIQQGKIEAQGEPVRRIYVDGKLFFGTDPMTALKSLPADAVESIQLFDAPSEEARLTGFDDGNTEKAINIVTKSKASESTIFKAEAAGGHDWDRAGDWRYLAGGNFSRFTQKQRLTVSLITNNVNTQKFGQPEISGDSDMDANGNIKNQPTGQQTINGGGINYVYDNGKLKVETSYFLDNTVNHTISQTENTYYPDEVVWQKSSVTRNEFFARTLNNRGNVRLEWKPNKANTLVISQRINTRGYDVDSRGNSGLNTQNGDTTSLTRSYNPIDNNYRNLYGELHYTRHSLQTRGRNLTLSLSYSLSGNDNDVFRIDSLRRQKISAKNDKPAYWKDGTLENWYTGKEDASNYVRGKLIFSTPFTRYQRVVANYSFRHDWGGLGEYTNNYDPETGEYTKLNVKRTNVYQRRYDTHSTGLGYTLYRPHLSINAGVDFQRAEQHRTEQKPNQVGTDLVFFDWTPNFQLKYTLSKKRYLRIRYNGRPQLPNINFMQDMLNTTSPQSLRQGNPDLKPAYEHSLEAFYNTTNIERSTNLTATLRAKAISDYFASQTETLVADTTYIPYYAGSTETFAATKGATVTRRINMDGYYAASGALTYSFSMRPIKSNINLSGAFDYVRSPSYYGDQPNIANICSMGFRVGVTSNISQNVDFNIYSTTAYNKTTNTVRDNNSYLNQNFFYSINVIFWKGFVFNSVLSWRYYSSSSAENMDMSYFVLNAALGKKVFRSQRGEVRLSVYDVLAQNTNRLHYIRDNYVQDQVTNTLGRYATLRFSYRFNSMSQPRKGTVEIKNAQQIGVKDVRKMSESQPQAKPATHKP